ncbi:MAG: hypothetical protein CMF89_03935 [Candidatus Marinimicrobia bacterium]|nr:hypothetical protein [Candidatus Neomarinimicrobiota bacterium]
MTRISIIILILIAVYLFIRSNAYFFKSIYETLKINRLLRIRLLRFIFSVLYRIFFRRFF